MQITFSKKVQTSAGEQSLTISGDYEVVRDPLGTGDSPTEFSFDYPSVIDEDSGQDLTTEFSLATLAHWAYSYMQGY